MYFPFPPTETTFIKIRNRIIKQNITVIHVQIIIEISIMISTQRFFLTLYKFFNTNVDDFKMLIPVFNTDIAGGIPTK